MPLTRREMLAGSAALLSTQALFSVAEAARSAATYDPILARLDAFVERYMREMHAPGMTLALADRDGVQRVVTYGLADVERGIKVRPEELFHIGSISKSFIALVLLQLRDEGKIDFDRPVTSYLPWFKIDTRFSAVTTHHLLTHSSGLHTLPSVFLTDNSRGHRAAYPPGQHFFYNNMGFALLGYLAWTLDGRELPELLRERIFKPLGMRSAEPVIDFDMRERTAKSYEFFQADRPVPRAGRLAEGDGLVMTDASGCIAAASLDMGEYLRMLCRLGAGPRSPLVSEQAFRDFSKGHIEAKEFGPEAFYGYGIAREQVDGENYIMHTGGMLTFASALRVNLDAGVGAFASINAMQGYRPTPVVHYALQLMQAQRRHVSLPAPTPLDAGWTEAKAGQYTGTFRAPDGKTLIVSRQGLQLHLEQPGGRIGLEPALEADTFVVLHASLERFPLMFTRKNPLDPESEVLEVAWGSDWYAAPGYTGAREFTLPAAWKAYEGHYRNDNPWVGSVRVLFRKGRLWLNGTTPLEVEGDVFVLRDEEHSTEWMQFLDEVNGRCMRIKWSGEDLRTRRGTLVAADGAGSALRSSVALFLLGFATFSLIYCTQPLLPNFAADFALTPAESSLALSVTTASLAVSLVVLGAWSESLGRRGLMFLSICLAALFNYVAAIAPGWHPFLGARVLMGIALGGVPAVAMAYIAEETPALRLGLAMGLYIGGTAFGGMMGRVAIGAMTHLSDWRPAMRALSVADFLAALAFWWLLPPSRRFSRRAGLSLRYHLQAWRQHLRHRELDRLFLVGMLAMGAFVSVYNYIAFRLLAAPYSLNQATIGLIFLSYLFGTFASFSGGPLVARAGRARALLVGAALMLLGLLLTLSAPLVTVVLGVIVVNIGFFITQSVASAGVGALAQGDKAHASSLYLLAYYVGASLLASCGGWFWSHGAWRGVALYCGALVLLFATIAARLRPAAGATGAEALPG